MDDALRKAIFNRKHEYDKRLKEYLIEKSKQYKNSKDFRIKNFGDYLYCKEHNLLKEMPWLYQKIMRWNDINIRTYLNVWETLEDINIDYIKEYIELQENKNDERLKRFKQLDFETYVDVDRNDVLDEMWDSDIKEEAISRGFEIKDYDDDDYEEDAYIELAELASKLSAFDTDRFFKEFMKNKRLYDKEQLIEFIQNII